MKATLTGPPIGKRSASQSAKSVVPTKADMPQPHAAFVTGPFGPATFFWARIGPARSEFRSDGVVASCPGNAHEHGPKRPALPVPMAG